MPIKLDNDTIAPADQQHAGESVSAPISRRKFLKILGTSSALGLSACADDAKQTIFPYVRGEVEQIPGVAVWYNTTCRECPAGCGIRVRTREGRAVKIEGNPSHPVNHGGVCALGQSALQALYDPDRVRQPLKRVENESGQAIYLPISWDEALHTTAQALNAQGARCAFVTAEVSGALSALLSQFCSQASGELAVLEPLQPLSLAKACELTYGVFGVPRFHFDKADTVINFGADFLETWISPCEFANSWARSRKAKSPTRYIMVEPRLSLTGASADLWLACNPRSELKLALFLLQTLLRAGKAASYPADIQSWLREITGDLSLEEVSADSGIEASRIVTLQKNLLESKSALCVAGGAANAHENSVAIAAISNLITLLSSGVGTAVDLGAIRKPRTSFTRLGEITKLMANKQIPVLFVHGANPVYHLSQDYGFADAARNCKLIVALSTHLDETSRLADIVLPIHHSLESWSDSESYEGCYSLEQPVMQPVFNSRHVGDILLDLARKQTKPIQANGAPVTSFEDWLKQHWASIHAATAQANPFTQFWKESVERGGFFNLSAAPAAAKPRINRNLFSLKFDRPKSGQNGKTVLLTYPSVRTFDGRAANRAWLMEVPDPMTQTVWDAWAEIHPQTAAENGLTKQDMVIVENERGRISVPVYVTDYIRPGVVALPMGYGQSTIGRYAGKVKCGNPLALHASSGEFPGAVMRLCGTFVSLSRDSGRNSLVVTQGSDSQHGRDLARTRFIADNNHHQGHDSSHAPKQMYHQREHPLYAWGMVIDLNSCTGCTACVVACYAENNIPVVGKSQCGKGREMAWLRIERFHDGTGASAQVSFLPMMCQQCHNAPCETVCPVYATHHSEDGLNAMVYNRCVGTRYCSNNCPYKVRRFNWYEYDWPEPLHWQLNPDVVKRSVGVMEKCNFCVQRIVEAKDLAKDLGRPVADGEVTPACAQSCPTQAITFGNMKDPNSRVSRLSHHERAYKVLDHHINTQPAVTYLERIKYKL